MMRFLKALGLGAGLMYFFDPGRGGRRRSYLQNKSQNVFYKLSDSLEKTRAEMAWKSMIRFMAVVGGVALVTKSLGGGRWRGTSLGLIGTALFVRALTNQPLNQLAGTGPDGSGLQTSNT
jgi:hypothetical protein